MQQAFFKQPKYVHSCWLVLVVLLMWNAKQQDKQLQEQRLNQAHRVKSIETPSSTSATIQQNLASSAAQSKSSFTEEKPQLSFAEQEKITLQGLAQKTQLHYVAVYGSNAQEYNQEEKRARYAQCNRRQQPITQDCWEYAYSAQKENTQNTVTVHILSNKKVTLVLNAYEPVQWILKGNTQNIALVYLSGYHSSSLMRRLPRSVPVYASFYDPSDCDFCQKSQLHYFQSEKHASAIQGIMLDYFGNPLDSFQGQYRAKEFSIQH